MASCGSSRLLCEGNLLYYLSKDAKRGGEVVVKFSYSGYGSDAHADWAAKGYYAPKLYEVANINGGLHMIAMAQTVKRGRERESGE